MKSDILEDLIQHEIRSLYSAEKQLIRALTKMARAACQPKVQDEFKTRLSESHGQMKRLEYIAMFMETSLHGCRCQGMEQLIQEALEPLQTTASARELDAGLIAAARHVSAYEIEGYILARTLISRLGFDAMEGMLQKSLSEKKAAATRLARLAKSLKPGGELKSNGFWRRVSHSRRR